MGKWLKTEFKNQRQYELVLALFIGFVFGFGFEIYLSDNFEWRSFVHRWQTLIAGALAFAASFLLFCSAVYSEYSKKRNKFFVARTFLPQSLVKLSNYLDKAILFYASKYHENLSESEKTNTMGFDKPALSREDFDDLRILAEYSDKRVSLVIARLIADFQVINSRIETADTKDNLVPIVGNKYELEIIAILFIDSVINRFYNYSRDLIEYDFNEISDMELKNKIGYLNRRIEGLNLKYENLFKYYNKSAERRGPETGFFSKKSNI